MRNLDLDLIGIGVHVCRRHLFLYAWQVPSVILFHNNRPPTVVEPSNVLVNFHPLIRIVYFFVYESQDHLSSIRQVRRLVRRPSHP